ncbi:O-antigen ligase family protein [Noviherbaspirillum sp. Root189]|uniref:O-antigen ligase family protein n=1 Tax=Noviherbaspirillum sp. Root189 TaxID=1736487 RepID=UPI00138EF150|nr:O-antigen ligase family protein [Noviherbaspirillum sp. Root189]
MITPPPLSPTEVMTNVIGALIVIPIVCGFVIKAPKWVVLGFLVVLFGFADSTWGQVEAQSGNIYSRGVGLFYFSLLNLVLLTAGLALFIKRLANPYGPQLAPPMTKYFAAFVFMLAGHVVVGLMIGKDLNVILGLNGFFNVLNMFVFMFLVISAFEKDRDMTTLIFMILSIAVIRGVFGGVRYFLFDGDTANPYRNFEGLNIKIYFFDISDNYVAALAAFCSAWLLTTPQVKLNIFTKVLLLGVVALEVAAVALSFRRSSLIGLGLMFVFLFLRLPARRKLFFAIAAAALLAMVASVFFQHRLQFNTASGGGILQSLIYDIAPSRGSIKDNRFYELYAAAQSMEGHWLFGRGTWGTFTGDRELLSYHGDDFGFVHSGFGHLILKSGLFGVGLFIAMLVTFITFYLRHRKSVFGNASLLADAGFAGFLFWIPTLLIGTPIIEFRTMMLFGLTLAMPFVAVGLQHAQVRTYQMRTQYAVA